LQQARAERVQIAASMGPIVSVGGAGEALRSSRKSDGSPGGQSHT
jgi:hypothetical protein